MLPERILLPDELTVDEPNPYRRRQKVIGIRRSGGGRFFRWVKAVCLVIFLPFALLLGVYQASQRVAASPRFFFHPRQDVILMGNRMVSTDDVLNALGFGDSQESRPASLFRVNLAAARRRVELIPWVESATISRLFPHQLRVTVVERMPVAYANVGGRIELVDKDGVFLPMLQKAPLDFPVLYGLDSAPGLVQRKAMLAPYERFVNATRGEVAGSGWTISEVDLSSMDDIRLLLVQGRVTILAHFGRRDYQRRFKTFVTAAPRVLANTPNVDSMDLRYRNQIVVDPVVQPADLKSEAASSRAAAH